MREILFRGKRVDNGEWVKGIYSPYDWDFFGNRENRAQMIIVSDDDYDGFWCDVISETVGQYTGLTDKNGKKIFEGDILKGFKYPYLSDGNYNYFAEIVWFDDVSAFGTYTFKNPKSKVRGISDGSADYMEEWNPLLWEIIGNIHDNPELLEGE